MDWITFPPDFMTAPSLIQVILGFGDPVALQGSTMLLLGVSTVTISFG